MTKEELLEKRKEHIRLKTPCHICSKSLGFEITPQGEPICIKCYVESKGELTPEKEKLIAEKVTKGIPKRFAYTAFVRDYFKCKRCGIGLEPTMLKPLRLENTINKPLRLKHIITVCPDCAEGNNIRRSNIEIPQDIIEKFKSEMANKSEEKILTKFKNILTQSCTLIGKKDNIRIYYAKPYTIYVEIGPQTKIVDIKSDNPPKEKTQKIQEKPKEQKPEKQLDEIIIQAHAKYNGVCQECGQRMDKEVIKLRRFNKDIPASLDNIYILCPDCKKGVPNPALKGYKVSEGSIKHLTTNAGMERKVAFEILSDFAAKYALVKFINNGKVRIYWSWDKTLPVSLIITANNIVTKVILKHERRKKNKSIEAARN